MERERRERGLRTIHRRRPVPDGSNPMDLRLLRLSWGRGRGRHRERVQGEGAAHDPSATACIRWIQSRGPSPAPAVVAVRRVMVHKPKLQCGPHLFFCRRWRGGEKILGDDVASCRFTAVAAKRSRARKEHLFLINLMPRHRA
jgi:hypothetical protein